MKKIIELCVYAAILLAAILFSLFGDKPVREPPPAPTAAQESIGYSYIEPERQALEGY